MRVLLLAWGVEPGPLGPSEQAVGLARALAVAGHRVRLVTRQDRDGGAVRIEGVEVHAVADPPPIVPAAMAAPGLDALAVAGRATSVAVRRLEEEPVDVVHAEGWSTAPVVTALQHSHDVPVLAAVEEHETTAADATSAELATALVEAAALRVARDPAARTTLPLGVEQAARAPGPPPARGPVHLVPPRGEPHHEAARALRHALAAPRRISHTWGRRPALSVVLDPRDLGAVARAVGDGVPVVTVPGAMGRLVAGAGAGAVVTQTLVAPTVDALLADRDHVLDLAAGARSVAATHAWQHVATAWQELATTAVERAGAPRLQPAD